MKIKKQSISIFLAYFFQFLVVIVVFSVCMLAVYFKVDKSLKENAQESNKTLLKQVTSTTDGYLDNTYSVATQLLLNSSVKKVIGMGDNLTSQSYYYLMLARDALRSSETIKTNDFIVYTYIYLSDSDIVITRDTVYSNSRLFYNKYLSNGYTSYDEWKKEMCDQHVQDIYPGKKVYDNGTYNNVIAYEFSIPLTASRTLSHGTLCLMLNESELHKILRDNNCENCWYYIIDGLSGRIICSSHGNEDTANFIELSNSSDSDEVFADDYVITKVFSRGGWLFVRGLPYEEVMSAINPILRTIIISFIICLAISIGLASYATYSNSVSLIKLVKTIPAVRNNTSNKLATHFHNIGHSFDEIINKNAFLLQQNKDSLPLLRSYFFEYLINSQNKSENELQDLMHQIKFPLNAHSYCCLFIGHAYDSTDVLTESNGFETNIVELICLTAEKYANELIVYPYSTGRGYVMVLFCSINYALDSELDDLVLDFCEFVQHESQDNLFFACGNSVSSSLELHISVANAYQVLSSSKFKPDYTGIHRFSEVRKSNDIYTYTQEDSSHLALLLRSGNYQECESYINKLLNINLASRSLSLNMVSQFMHELIGTLIEVARPMGEDGEKIITTLVNGVPSDISVNTDTKLLTNQILMCSKQICDSITLVKDEKKKQLAMEICSYINNNYSDSYMSLCSIAEKFEMSISYLSTFFSTQTGEHLSHYIESIRIEHACALLLNETLSIDQIASACGYNSAMSFRRAFKRLKDINPSEYKSTVQSNEEA